MAQIGRFDSFLDSLSTAGGAILLLFIANAAMLSLIVTLSIHGKGDAALIATLGTTFGNFSGALLMGLQARVKTNGDIKTTSTTTTTSVVSPSTVPIAAVPTPAPILTTPLTS